jgi:quaternary ammonium compound-resistance protein SugE
MAWFLLLVAGLLEILWAFTMKLSEGFTRPSASLITVLAMLASFGLLSASMKTLPLGTAYTVWTGIGAVGAFVERRLPVKPSLRLSSLAAPPSRMIARHRQGA